jgi:hypothetical protein
MDEVELLKALGDVWDDSAEIVESMHALRKRIEALYADKGDDELAAIYELVNAQVDLVLGSLRVTLDRIGSSVHAWAPKGSTAPEKSFGEQKSVMSAGGNTLGPA